MLWADFGGIQLNWVRFIHLTEGLKNNAFKIEYLQNRTVRLVGKEEDSNTFSFIIEQPDAEIKEETNLKSFSLQEISAKTNAKVAPELLSHRFFALQTEDPLLLDTLASVNNWQLKRQKNDSSLVSVNRKKILMPARYEQVGGAIATHLPEEVQRFLLLSEIFPLLDSDNSIVKRDEYVLMQNRVLARNKMNFVAKKIKNMKKILSLKIKKEFQNKENRNEKVINDLLQEYLFYFTLDQTFALMINKLSPNTNYFSNMENLKLSYVKEKDMKEGEHSFLVTYPDRQVRGFRSYIME
jgi:hypothetical protein